MDGAQSEPEVHMDDTALDFNTFTIGLLDNNVFDFGGGTADWVSEAVGGRHGCLGEARLFLT